MRIPNITKVIKNLNKDFANRNNLVVILMACIGPRAVSRPP